MRLGSQSYWAADELFAKIKDMISVVINTLNDGKNIKRAVDSVKWADEILVCDMHSDDKTVEVAKKLGAKVISIKKAQFVELVRNQEISKASGEWILILDPDEEIPESLAGRLKDIAARASQIDFVEIPRKNIIFGKWMRASMWWPDYNVRFFKKGKVKWSDKIHRGPEASGEGMKLDPQEQYAILHHHYDSISQFLKRMNRYTDVQAKELADGGVKFHWSDLIQKPLGEFLGRFFANRGFEDGLHGLALSLLQGFSHLIVYLKLWEMEKFTEEEISLSDLKLQSAKGGQQLKYWFKYGNLSKNPFKRFIQRAKNKVC